MKWIGQERQGRSLSTSQNVRWIVSHLVRYPALLSFIAVGLIGTTILYCSSAAMIGLAFDAVLHGASPMERLLHISLVFVVMRIVHGCMGLGANLTAELLAQRLKRAASDELYASLLQRSSAFHDRHSIGDLTARATSDMNELATMINPGLRLTYESALFVLVPLGGIALINFMLLPLPVLLIALMSIDLWLYVRRLDQMNLKLRSHIGLISSCVSQMIAAITAIKSYGREFDERTRFEAEASRLYDFWVERGLVEARYRGLLWYRLGLGLALVQAAVQCSAGTLTVGQAAAFISYFVFLRMPASFWLVSVAQIQAGIAAGRRVLAVIAAETSVPSGKGHKAPIRGEIIFQDVSLDRGGLRALHEINLLIPAGSTVAIVGHTGSGKTTLCCLLNRIYDPTAGRVLVDGVDVRCWDINSLRTQITLVEQSPFLFSSSVRDNITFGVHREVSDAEVDTVAQLAQADKFIDQLPNGYATLVGERGAILSGGQRQRISIARGLLTDPAVLILDGASSALDSITEHRLIDGVLKARQGRTNFIITHRTAQIKSADLVMLLRNGHVEAFGPHKDLMISCPSYRRTFRNIDGSSEVMSECI